MMDFFRAAVEWVLHLDRHLTALISAYGAGTYFILFVIIFCETGLVVTPFLPGDSLLFASGALAAAGTLDLVVLLLLFSFAAVCGDAVNYSIGRKAGRKILSRKEFFGFSLKKEHIKKTQEFYERHGGKAIVFARFLPIVRTFAPFVAGVGEMPYTHFFFFNLVGGVIWVFLFVLGGYFFGNFPIIKENFSLVLIGIVALTIVPAIVEYLRSRLRRARS
jgi:membrane-associated protein